MPANIPKVAASFFTKRGRVDVLMMKRGFIGTGSRLKALLRELQLWVVAKVRQNLRIRQRLRIPRRLPVHNGPDRQLRQLAAPGAREIGNL